MYFIFILMIIIIIKKLFKYIEDQIIWIFIKFNYFYIKEKIFKEKLNILNKNYTYDNGKNIDQILILLLNIFILIIMLLNFIQNYFYLCN